MKMYRCESCGHLFEEGEEKKEFSYLGDYGSKKIYEHSYSCPVCGGDYEEVVKCTKCGSYNAEAGEKLCDDCKKQSVERFEKFVDENFTDEEREYINKVYEGEWI